MKTIKFKLYSEKDLDCYLKPGSMFIPSKNFLKYLRIDRTRTTYYKFTISELFNMKKKDLPILMYIKTNTMNVAHFKNYTFLLGKELVHIYEDDFLQTNFNIKILSHGLDNKLK